MTLPIVLMRDIPDDDPEERVPDELPPEPKDYAKVVNENLGDIGITLVLEPGRVIVGNSGVFVWATKESIESLAKAGKPGLPHGIEVQVLDLDFAKEYEQKHKKAGDWFTCHGDVFAVGVKMKPFPPLSPNGSRSFPSKNLSKGVNEWNHYYIRAINGEIRLWVNGEEVSGGTGCDPRSGFLCLESEGSPIDFKNLRIRELP